MTDETPALSVVIPVYNEGENVVSTLRGVVERCKVRPLEVLVVHDFDEDTTVAVVKRLHFIKRAQQLGFSLKEISELLLLRVDTQTSCDEVKQRTENVLGHRHAVRASGAANRDVGAEIGACKPWIDSGCHRLEPAQPRHEL